MNPEASLRLHCQACGTPSEAVSYPIMSRSNPAREACLHQLYLAATAQGWNAKPHKHAYCPACAPQHADQK